MNEHMQPDFKRIYSDHNHFSAAKIKTLSISIRLTRCLFEIFDCFYNNEKYVTARSLPSATTSTQFQFLKSIRLAMELSKHMGKLRMAQCMQLCMVMQLMGQILHDIHEKQRHLLQTELYTQRKQQEVSCRPRIEELAWL